MAGDKRHKKKSQAERTGEVRGSFCRKFFFFLFLSFFCLVIDIRRYVGSTTTRRRRSRYIDRWMDGRGGEGMKPI